MAITDYLDSESGVAAEFFFQCAVEGQDCFVDLRAVCAIRKSATRNCADIKFDTSMKWQQIGGLPQGDKGWAYLVTAWAKARSWAVA